MLPNVGVKHLEELIDLGSNYNIKIHAWHWMMNVGGSEECRKNLEWYSVNALGKSCRDFHPYVNYYNFSSPFSEGAREHMKKDVREMQEGKHLFIGIFVNVYGDNRDDFEKAINLDHENGAKRITFFTVNSLSNKQLAIIKKYNEKFNK